MHASTDDPLLGMERALGALIKRLLHARVTLTDGRSLERAAYLALATLTETGPQRTTTLAQSLAVDASTASRQVSALEAVGFVDRQPDPADRRASFVAATADGVAAYRAARAARRAHLAHALRDWDPTELRQVTALLERLQSALGAAGTDTTRPAVAPAPPSGAPSGGAAGTPSGDVPVTHATPTRRPTAGVLT